MAGRCHLMPQPHAITWSNIYWQKLQMNEKVTFLLYSAILDNREQTDVRPCLRILAHSDTRKPPKPWCYLWYNASGPPVITQVIRTDYLHYRGKTRGGQRTFILTCRIPIHERLMKPKAVSLVKTPCSEAKTLLEVIGDMQRNEETAYVNGKPPVDGNRIRGWNAAVCGTSLFYFHHDFSARLVEWLEVLRAIGFSQVFLHETNVHPNIEKP
ncbi:hypothetical protein SK128_013173 [Halocaridina rubra]|uniref:Uncharacterized protein n=1 Tax=Halocaridina rubra TaxID=373956 RepID=A0AAN8WVI2_HALRR